MMAGNWAERTASFSRSPTRFLCCTAPEVFLAELLRELRDDRAPYSVKALLLSPLCEHPTLLCPSTSSGEDTALELMSVFAQCPAKNLEFRSLLLLSLTSVLLCSSCVAARSRASRDFLDLLLQVAQDVGDFQVESSLVRSLRATACDCLRELEACCPGILSQHLELLSGLRQQESSRLHQAYTGLHILALRNVVFLLAEQTGCGAEELKALLGGNMVVAWEAQPDSASIKSKDSALPSPLILVPMGTVPTLQTGPECKELRSILSSLLEESYLLTPLSQAALLHGLIEVVAMVPSISPAIFRAQLLRLLGTSKVCLFHTTLLMKAAFTDSLFSAEDEAFILKRLVGLSQHPLLGPQEKLFYMDYLLHFPENRPIGGGDGDETLPVLLTPRLAVSLVPTVFNDSGNMLARFNLVSLVYLEEGEEGEAEGAGGLAYLYDHLKLLLNIIEHRGSRERVVTFFRAAFLFLLHFCHVEHYASDLRTRLCELYRSQTWLAPHMINLANQIQDTLRECGWAVALLGALQSVITEPLAAQVTPTDLCWHLKVLARVADEGEIGQSSTLGFLLHVITSSSSLLCVSGDWRLGNNLLEVCRRLLLHPSLDAILIPLADILQHLACHYGDTDIQDHARLYYTLLTTLSREKLGGVLAHGMAEGGRKDKNHSLSSIMAESEELTNALTIRQTERSIFQLVEADNCKAQRGSDSTQNTDIHPNLNLSDDSQCQEIDVLEAYRAQFDSPGFASEVTLLYKLIHMEACDPRFDRIFSVRLHFELMDAHYEELGDISVPCLFRDRAPPAVRLTLTPREPYPTTLHASAIFTTQDGLSWHTTLPDVDVAFQQVFKPLVAPSTWEQDSKLRAFEALWGEFASGKRGETDLSDCAISLFCSELGERELSLLVEKHFSSYLITNPVNTEEYKVLLFLPPQSHVLLKIRSEEDAVQFNIATDNWKLLPYINSFLLTITLQKDNVCT